MITISFHTLGCKVNQAETFQMQQEVDTLNNFDIVDFKQKCDIAVLNTCTVTKLADKKSRQIARSLANRAKFLIITGCYTKVPFGIKEFENKKNIIILPDKTEFKSVLLKIAEKEYPASKQNVACKNKFTNRYRANLIIQNGCNNFCSYCIVPFVRGREISYPVDKIFAKAKKLADNGIKEIILTGINTGANKKLVEIIRKISDLDSILRIRLSSIEPQNVDDNLIKEISKNEKVCKHLHIPLQSGDDFILEKMGRKYSFILYKAIINKIREKIPDIAISTDIIVGFPFETEENFVNTINACKEIQFSRLHIFRFSPRPGTKAYTMENKVPEKIISERAKIMQNLRKELMLNFHKRFIGRKKEVLIETKDKKSNMYEGLTTDYIRVLFNSNINVTGTIQNITIKKAFEEYVIGSL